MAQYCRYCEHAYRVCDHSYEGLPEKRNDSAVYCYERMRFISREQAKQTNNCKHFQLNPVDALRENVKGYQPTGKKIVQFGGLGKQITLDEIIGGNENG